MPLDSKLIEGNAILFILDYWRQFHFLGLVGEDISSLRVQNRHA